MSWGWQTGAAAPRVAALDRNLGPTGGGYALTITGDSFTNASSVSFGNVPASSFTVNSDTSITAIVSAQALGVVDVTVTTPSGASVLSLADQFAYVNGAPIGTDNTVTTQGTTPYSFAPADFGFTDPNDTPSNNFQGVLLTTLPGAGTLTNNGSTVTAGDFLSVSDLNAGHLSYTPPSGSGTTSFTFQVQDDGGIAHGGIDLDPIASTMTIIIYGI